MSGMNSAGEPSLALVDAMKGADGSQATHCIKAHVLSRTTHNENTLVYDGALQAFYACASGNPLSRRDPLGLFDWPSLPQGVVNTSAGVGDGISTVLSFGLYSTANARAALGIDGGVDMCSASYRGGKYAGYAWGAATLWAAGLNGGSNSVFWSGYQQGARGIAESLGGTTLESTPIGSVLDFASNTLGIPGLTPVWNAASATFALNAAGTADAVILAEGATWTSIELPILTWRGIPIVFH